MARSLLAAGATAALLLVTACGGQAALQRQGTGLSAAATPPPCGPYTAFRPGNFSHPSIIDNHWFPLAVGTQMIYKGRSSQDGTPTPHLEEFTVTGLTKMIEGVQARVILDRDLNNGDLDEQELTLFAQDDDGNVWNLGEYPEDFENGRFVGAPDTWVAGSAGAEGGVQVPAVARPGTPAYRQGFSPDIDFLDCARTYQTGQNICGDLGCHHDVLVVDEWSPLDPASGHQRKFYAPRVGNVKITAVGDPEAEETRLAEIRHLDSAELQDVDKKALQLDQRAYHAAADVYAGTAPAR